MAHSLDTGASTLMTMLKPSGQPVRRHASYYIQLSITKTSLIVMLLLLAQILLLLKNGLLLNRIALIAHCTIPGTGQARYC